jgi:hypothetical protein
MINAIKYGYFFGCFYLLTRKTYEALGTHKEVKNQILEDVALGEKVKLQGYKLKLFRGEHQVDTMQVGDFTTILQGLGRGINLIPFARNDVMSFFNNVSPSCTNFHTNTLNLFF